MLAEGLRERPGEGSNGHFDRSKEPVGYLVPKVGQNGRWIKQDGRWRVAYLSPDQFERALGSSHLPPGELRLPLWPELARARAVWEIKK